MLSYRQTTKSKGLPGPTHTLMVTFDKRSRGAPEANTEHGTLGGWVRPRALPRIWRWLGVGTGGRPGRLRPPNGSLQARSPPFPSSPSIQSVSYTAPYARSAAQLLFWTFACHARVKVCHFPALRSLSANLTTRSLAVFRTCARRSVLVHTAA